MEKRVATRVAKDWFFSLSFIALWYFAIFILVNIALKIISQLNLPDFRGFELLEVSSASSYAFMLVLGIIMPLVYHKYYVSLGVTRKQMVQGMLLGVVGVSLLISLVNAGIYLVGSTFDNSLIDASKIPFQLLRDLLIQIFYYLLGWLVAWGFTCGRFVTAASSILIGVLALNGPVALFGDLVINDDSPAILPEFASLGIVLLAAVILAFVLMALIRRLPIKAN